MVSLNKKMTAAMLEQVVRVNEKPSNVTTLPDTTERTGAQELPIALLRLDGGTQSRAELSISVISKYAEDMQSGDLFPAVDVFYDGQSYWLADGFHRVRATEQVGATKIFADVKQGTQRDAVLFSLGANKRHGLRKSEDDNKRSIERLLRDNEWNCWSNTQIAKHVGVSESYVRQMREELGIFAPSAKIVERNGKKYVMDTSKIGGGKKKPTSDKSKADAESLLNQQYQQANNALAEALESAPEPVALFVKERGIIDLDKINLLSDGYRNKRDWVNDVLTTEYIQVDDDAVHYSESALNWQNAIKKKYRLHRALNSDGIDLDPLTQEQTALAHHYAAELAKLLDGLNGSTHLVSLLNLIRADTLEVLKPS
jgi:uncharacterized ParB-like nuclease family protein